MTILLRNATHADVPMLEALIARSARGLSSNDYRPEQIEGALRGAFGVDTQLLMTGPTSSRKKTVRLAGCGGWSFRSTLFGGDAARGATPLCSIRSHKRQRSGRSSLTPRRLGAESVRCCSSAASARRALRGFLRVELMATLPGVKLYAARGYVALPPVRYDLGGGESIEFIPMRKDLR